MHKFSQYLNVYPRRLCLDSFVIGRNLSSVPPKSNKKVYTPEQFANYPSVDFNLGNTSRQHLAYYFFKNNERNRAYFIENPIEFEFERNLPIRCLIHGYNANHKSPWMEIVKQKYFKQGPHNILLIDWSKSANLSYRCSAANTLTLGGYIAEFLLKTNMPIEKIHIIGHSLGAHLSGFIGKSVYELTGRKLPRITALDPAGPGFDRLTDNRLRLCSNDAEFVDVIHTDIDYFGLKRPAGHVDFYVNGGKNQPGCNRHVDDTCSHFRSTLLFIESIGNNAIEAKQARYVDGETIEIVENGRIVGFGDGLTGAERGVYFVETNEKAPFFKLPTTKQ